MTKNELVEEAVPTKAKTMENESLGFTPCSEICPAVTGKPYNSVRYCPMQEHDRYRSMDGFEAPDNNGYKGYDLRAYPKGQHPLYDHPDATDCCANFQCCIDKWQDSGLLHVAADLVKAADQGNPIVHVEK